MIKLLKRNAFTLIELMTVVFIVGILTTLPLIKYFIVTEKIHAKSGEKILLEIYGAQKRYFIDHDAFATDLADLDISPKGSEFLSAPVACSNTDDTDSCHAADSIAEIYRNSSEMKYELRINNNMKTTCTGTAPADICKRLGY